MEIRGFTGQLYRYLSNFYPSPITLDYDTYPSGEHAFQAGKVSPIERNIFTDPTLSCQDAKRLGKSVDLWGGWEVSKHEHMLRVQLAKYRQNRELGERLKDTGDALLVETNTWHDDIWGDCICARHKDTPGRNALGLALMYVRAAI